eukprot:2210036-Pleurochrysis_carterae.AAC.6
MPDSIYALHVYVDEVCLASTSGAEQPAIVFTLDEFTPIIIHPSHRRPPPKDALGHAAQTAAATRADTVAAEFPGRRKRDGVVSFGRGKSCLLQWPRRQAPGSGLQLQLLLVDIYSDNVHAAQAAGASGRGGIRDGQVTQCRLCRHATMC